MLNNRTPNDQLGEYARIPLRRRTSMTFSITPFSEANMKSEDLFEIWNINRTVYEIEQKRKTKKPGKLWTILKSLRYADKKDRVILFFSMLCSIISGLSTPLSVYYLLAPVLSKFIKEETVGNPYNINITDEIAMVKLYGYGLLIAGLLSILISMSQIMGSGIASHNIMAKIKTAYLSKLLSLEVSWHDKSQEQFVSIVSHDLRKMQVLFDSEMTNAIDMFSFFFSGCIAGFIVSWKVALLSLGLMFIAMGIMFFILRASKKRGNSRQQYNRKCTKITSEVLGNARTVAAYGGEYKEIERYNSTLKMANKYGLKHAIVISAGKAYVYFQLCICYIAAYYFAVKLYLIGDFVDPGFLMILLTVQINAIYQFSYMINTISEVNIAADSAYKVMKFLDTETDNGKSIELGIKPDTFKGDISFRNVEFFYPTNLQTKVFHDLTLDIEPGKVTAVVGTSGAGKSTIVNLISRLYDVTGGQILIGGLDIKKLDVSLLRNQIAVVGQEPVLFDTSIEENIRYGKTTATMEEIIEAAKISYAHGFIEKLPYGYGSIVGETGSKLSGGQKQRIAIARAIVRKPKLLLLDEATSALDFHSEGIVKEALDNAMRDRTILIIAHRMSTVRKADVIYALKEGRVMEKGSHSELMELKGYYYSLAKMQEPEEKDKIIVKNQGDVSKEDFIEKAEPLVKETLEVLQNNKIEWLRMKNLKVIAVWLLTILFSTITSTFLPTFYYIMSFLYQTFTYSTDVMNQIALIDVGYLFGLGLISFFSVISSGVMSTIATQIWLGKLQKKAFNKIVSMDISWFDMSGNSPNECLEILTGSPPLIESVTGERAAQVAIFILGLLFTLCYSFFISSSLTLMNLPIFIIFIIVVYLRVRPRDSDARFASLTTRSTKVATEYVQNVKTIQMLNCQKYVVKQFNNMLMSAKKEAIENIFWNAAVSSFPKALIRWSMGVVLIFGAHVITTGTVKGTSFMSVVLALSSASSLARPALMLMSQYPSARLAAKRLYRIAYTKTSLNTLIDEGIKPEISGNIVFQDVVFSYSARKDVKVFNKLNLKIEAGKMVALVGNSGCGKSTVISLLERFYLPNEGKILIDGNDINDINVRYLRSQMGLVSQESVLFDMTIKENILYGLEEEVTMDKIIEAAKVANIHNFIMKLPQAYDTSVGERGSKLSGGQKQRIAIARAILRNPKILLLDEATSALDTENEKAVQEALEKASIGRTCIVIAHRLSTIRRADKIIVLQSGAVVEEGNHQQLIERRGYYFNLLHK